MNQSISFVVMNSAGRYLTKTGGRSRCLPEARRFRTWVEAVAACRGTDYPYQVYKE